MDKKMVVSAETEIKLTVGDSHGIQVGDILKISPHYGKNVSALVRSVTATTIYIRKARWYEHLWWWLWTQWKDFKGVCEQLIAPFR